MGGIRKWEPEPGKLEVMRRQALGAHRELPKHQGKSSVASELSARGGTVCTMLFLLFQEIVGIICPFPKCKCPSLASSHPQPLPGKVGTRGSPSSTDTRKTLRGEDRVGSPDWVPLFLL